MVGKGFKKYWKIGLILVIVFTGTQLFGIPLAPYVGGWEINTQPLNAYEHGLGVEKSFASEFWWEDYSHGLDFDAAYWGAPDLRVGMSSWIHTDGTFESFLVPELGITLEHATETPWDQPVDTLEIPDVPVQVFDEAGNPVLAKDGVTPVYKTTTLYYDLHYFYQTIKLATDADYRKAAKDWRGEIYEHETSESEDHTYQGHGDLGRPMDATVRFKTSLDNWPIRSTPEGGRESDQKAGIMLIKVKKLWAGNALNLAMQEKAKREDVDDWGDWQLGNMVQKGLPQQGENLPMFVDPDYAQSYTGQVVDESNYALPRPMPTELYFNLHAKFRCGYIIGWDTTWVNEVIAMIPVNGWIIWGMMMEILTVKGFWLYTDLDGDPVVPDWERAEGGDPDPKSFWESLLDLLPGFWPWGGLMGIGLLLIVIVVAIFLLKKSPQYQIYRRFKD